MIAGQHRTRMTEDSDRRAILLQWDEMVKAAKKVPISRRPKAETIISKVCEKNGISRRTLFDWHNRLH